MAARQQSLLNVQSNLANVVTNIQNNLANVIKNTQDSILDSLSNITTSSEEKPKLYFFGDNLTWTKAAKFKLVPLGSSTLFGPYSDPILPEMISEYLIGEPINNFYETINVIGSGFTTISIGKKLHNNNNFSIAPAGGNMLEYIKSNVLNQEDVGVPGGVPSAVVYPMNTILDNFKAVGKKINSNDFVCLSSIFMDLVYLGATMYTNDLFDFSDPMNPVPKSPDTPGMIDNLLKYYNIVPEGNREQKYERAIELLAEEHIKFVNRLKSEGAKKIIYFLYKQESLHQMPVISNGNRPTDVPPFSLGAFPGKTQVLDKQAEFFDKKIREAFANDPHVYVYDYDITKIIKDAGSIVTYAPDGTPILKPVFLNTKTEVMLTNEFRTVAYPDQGIIATIDAINNKLALGKDFSYIDSDGQTYNTGTPPEGSNVYNSVWYTGEHTTPTFNVYVAEDLVHKVREFFG